MAFILADRVKETASAPGTGTVTLLGAASGYQSFSAGIGASNTTYYTIADQTGTNWEVGYGTIGAGGTTLARTTVLASSNSGLLVNFSSGTQDVWCDYPAQKAVSLDSAGAIRAGSNPYIDFEDGNGTTVAAGRMWYGASEGNWNLGMGGGNITQQVGEELFRYGKASSAITDSPLQLVYKTGVVGASGNITFAPAVAGITDADQIIGCATENIALNAFGRVTTYGIIHGITTNGTAYGETWADNDDIYYNPTTGGLTKTLPSAPNLKVLIGTVINAGSGGSGSFIVKLGFATYLSRLSDVQITSATGGQLLTYNQTGSYWKNTSLSAGTGISVTPTAGGAITVANTGVTSVTGTAPVVSSGGATPAISMAAATGSVNGYLTSTDWTTFNNKGSGTVTAVSVTSANGFAGTSSGGATPALTLSTSISGVLKGNGTAISAATSGTDYSAGTSALSTGILKSTTTTGALTIAVAADFPTLNQNTTGTAANVTGVVALANGGTGQTTASAAFNALSPITTTGDLILGNGTNSATRLGIGASTYVLTSNGTTASWAAPAGGSAAGSNTQVQYNNSGAFGASSSFTYVSGTGALTAPQVVASNGLVVNNMTVSSSYSIPSGYSASSVGPVTVGAGASITVPSGSRWVVL
jgi:hypothetical protein